MKELFEQIKSLKFLVIGDVMLDRYVIGEVSRISPEAPVPVLTVQEEKSVAGGASNVALNLRSLGSSVETIGWFGADQKGNKLVEILSTADVKVDTNFRFSSAPTISKSRVTASNQQICRVDREAHVADYSPDLRVLGDLLIPKVKTADAVIISDYGKGLLSSATLKAISACGKCRKLKLALKCSDMR